MVGGGEGDGFPAIILFGVTTKDILAAW